MLSFRYGMGFYRVRLFNLDFIAIWTWNLLLLFHPWTYKMGKFCFWCLDWICSKQGHFCWRALKIFPAIPNQNCFGGEAFQLKAYTEPNFPLMIATTHNWILMVFEGWWAVAFAYLIAHNWTLAIELSKRWVPVALRIPGASRDVGYAGSSGTWSAWSVAAFLLLPFRRPSPGCPPYSSSLPCPSRRPVENYRVVTFIVSRPLIPFPACFLYLPS